MKKGFTLIELMVVISIIALLASAILVGLSSARARGRDAQRIKDLTQIQSAVEFLYAKNDAYPISVLSVIDSNNALLQSIGVLGVPTDPLSPSQDYMYVSNNAGTHYILRAVLEQDRGGAPLNNDIDNSDLGADGVFGIVGGVDIDCDDGIVKLYYCIGF